MISDELNIHPRLESSEFVKFTFDIINEIKYLAVDSDLGLSFNVEIIQMNGTIL